MRSRSTTNADDLALRRLLADRTDEAAARVVAERLMPRLASFLRRHTPALSREDADDLAREALADALAHADHFDAARAAASTWLHGIARRRLADHLRRHGREVPLADDWSGDDEEAGAPGAHTHHRAAIHRAGSRLVAPPAADPELARTIRRVIAELPEQQRRAAEAHYLDGRAPRDVDEAYGWRPNTANVYLSHARRAMRGKLEALGVPLRAPPAARTAAAGGSTRQPVALAGAVPLVYAVTPVRRRLIVGRAWSVPLALAA